MLASLLPTLKDLQLPLRLRLWDDRAKVAGLPTPPLSHYLARARRCALAA